MCKTHLLGLCCACCYVFPPKVDGDLRGHPISTGASWLAGYFSAASWCINAYLFAVMTYYIYSLIKSVICVSVGNIEHGPVLSS